MELQNKSSNLKRNKQKSSRFLSNLKYYEDKQYYGTDNYYKIQNGLYATDGVYDVAEKFSAFWILDIIWSITPKLKYGDGFCVCYAVVNDRKKKNNVTFYCDDGNYNLIYKQQIPFSDLKNNLKFYVQQNANKFVIMLPSEY